MPRTHALFDWIFGLKPRGRGVELSFESVPDRGMDEVARQARAQKEAQALASLRSGTMARVHDLAGLHRFVFQEHRAYAASSSLDSTSASVDANALARGGNSPGAHPASAARFARRIVVVASCKFRTRSRKFFALAPNPSTLARTARNRLA